MFLSCRSVRSYIRPSLFPESFHPSNSSPYANSSLLPAQMGQQPSTRRRGPKTSDASYGTGDSDVHSKRASTFGSLMAKVVPRTSSSPSMTRKQEAPASTSEPIPVKAATATEQRETVPQKAVYAGPPAQAPISAVWQPLGLNSSALIVSSSCLFLAAGTTCTSLTVTTVRFNDGSYTRDCTVPGWFCRIKPAVARVDALLICFF